MEIGMFEAVAAMVAVGVFGRLGWIIAGRVRRKVEGSPTYFIRTGTATDGREFEWVEDRDGNVLKFWAVDQAKPVDALAPAVH